MKLSLCTVTYNELHNKLPRLLYSIERFIGDGYHEHLIWDNNEDDNTYNWLLEMQKREPRIKVFHGGKNRYDLPAYNEIARLCGADILLAINPNTRILSDVDIESLLKPFQNNNKLMLLGRPGPHVKRENATPHGVGGWGWVARLLTERDFWEEGDIDTSHVQTWCFLFDRKKFLEVGGFQFRNQLFDMRWPEKRHEEKPIDFQDKGLMISAEIELSVRAKRTGNEIAYMDPWPFYHYFSHGKVTPGQLDKGDVKYGFVPLGYEFGMYGEDKFLKDMDS